VREKSTVLEGDSAGCLPWLYSWGWDKQLMWGRKRMAAGRLAREIVDPAHRPPSGDAEASGSPKL